MQKRPGLARLKYYPQYFLINEKAPQKSLSILCQFWTQIGKMFYLLDFQFICQGKDDRQFGINILQLYYPNLI